MNQNFYDKLNNVIAKDSILTDEPMSRHTTFRVGGPADFFVTPKAKEEVRDVDVYKRQADNVKQFWIQSGCVTMK